MPLGVRSLGLYELGAVPALDEALEFAAGLGLDLSEHRARSLKGEQLGDADLVLGFERIHVAEAVVEAGADRGRTFTLPELVGLLGATEQPDEDDAEARAREALQRAHAARDGLPPPPLLPEVTDPWGGSPEAYTETGARVAELCEELVSSLFGRPAAGEAQGTGSRRGSSPAR